jgi:hypothetical protein
MGAAAEILNICRVCCGGAGLLGVGPGLLVGLLAGLFVERDDALARLRYVRARAAVLQIRGICRGLRRLRRQLRHQLRPFLLDQFSDIVGDFGDVFRLKQELVQPFEILRQHDVVGDNPRCVDTLRFQF